MTRPDEITLRPRRDDVPAFPGYGVDPDGCVWTCHIPGTRRLAAEWRELNSHVDKATGYRRVSLRRDGRTIKKAVHQLVLETFVGPCPSGMQGCHLNGIKADCRLENLRWGTPESNEADKVGHGTSNRGERQGRSRLRESDIAGIFAMRRDLPNATMEEIGILFGVSKMAIANILYRKNWAWVEVSPETEPAKLQDWPGRMTEWNAEQVEIAYDEALRKLQGQGDGDAPQEVAHREPGEEG